MSHSISLSVSVLNVLLNLFVLFLVAIGGEIAQYGIYKSTQLQLKRRGTAPFVTEPDDVVSHFRNRLVSARKSRRLLNLVLVLVSASLFFGEICSEVGVDASQRCEPRVFNTMGLCAEPFHHILSDSRVVTNAYHTRIAAWNNHELRSHPVYEGFRKNFNGRESFSHPPRNKTQRVVVSGCATSTPVRIEPYNVTLTFSHSMNVWQTYVSKLTLGNASKPTSGFGDLTSNGKTLSAFLVVPSPDASSHARVTILEYHSQPQLRKVLLEYKENKSSGDVHIPNEEYMVSYKLWCSQFSHSSEMFARALQVYRSVQLEDPEYIMQNVFITGNVYKTVPCMNASDAMRAAITLALMNEKSCKGETFEYTECGIYHWKFLAPLLILFGFVVIFAVSNGLLVMIEKADIDIPYSSSAWSALALESKTGIGKEAKGSETNGNEIPLSETNSLTHRGIYQLVEGEDGRKEVRFIFKKPQEARDVSQKDMDKDEKSQNEAQNA